MPKVQVDRDAGGVLTCWIDNAERRNALDDAMLATLTEAMTQPPSGTRLIVLRGRHRTFCSGRDLRELDAKGLDAQAALAERIAPARRLARAVTGCTVPTIAVVEGKAVGLGVALASWCDLVLAEEKATFSVPEARVGVAPSFTAVSLVRAVGQAAAVELCFTGRSLPASEARTLGLVQRMAVHGELDAALAGLCQELLSASPQALMASKRLLRGSAAMSFEQAIDLAVDTAIASMQSEDAHEGMQAFQARRTPAWAEPAA